MGVMACERTDCPRIMCNRVILDGRMYICDTCYSELLEYKESWEPPMSSREIYEVIEEFMSTVPGAYTKLREKVDIDEVFERLTNG